MNIIFMGTPDFAATILRALLTNPKHRVLAAVTQPDRPKGRGYSVVCSPVKVLAMEAGVPVLQPETLRGAAARAVLTDYAADVYVVAACGLILPPRVLSLPPNGCLNVHASLLPKYRGASPIHRALLNGDTETGITIIQMDRGIDTGDMMLSRALPIEPGERFAALNDRLARLGGACILEALAQVENGIAVHVPQDHASATYAPLIAKEDGHIDWRAPSSRIVCITRALDPWPGPFTFYDGQAMKIWACETGCETELADTHAEPGTILLADPVRGLWVKTGDGAVRVTEMQAGGGKRMKAADYLRGHPMCIGAALK